MRRNVKFRRICPPPTPSSHIQGPRGCLLTQSEDNIWELDTASLGVKNLVPALELIADAVGAKPAEEEVAAAWEAGVMRPPPAPRGPLTAETMSSTLARLQVI